MTDAAYAQEPMLAPPVLYTVTVKKTAKKGRVRVAAVPPEEFLVDRNARTIEDASVVAHRSYKTVSDLVAMGYKKDEVEEHAGEDDGLDFADERSARIDGDQFPTTAADPSQRRVLYVEAYMRIDHDGDGIAELRKVCTMGPAYKVMANEEAPERPFADFCPDPEPHAFFGMSVADVVMDIQRIKSKILRNTLDSLAATIHPRTLIVEGQANLDDVLNTEVGAVIRQKQAGAVAWQEVPFVGGAAMSMLGYMDKIKESRTGMSAMSQGLDDKALAPGVTAAAVSGMLSQAQEHIELIARIFAETGFTRLYRGILRLVAEKQDDVRQIQLGKQWVQMDKAVTVDRDVVCNVALGGGTGSDKMAALAQIAAKQEAMLAQLGPNNPLVSPAQLRNTYAKMAEQAGYKDPDAFWLDPARAPPAPPPPPPPPDPNMILAQAEQAKADNSIKIAAAKMQLEEQKAKWDADLQRDKLMMEMFIKSNGAIGADAVLNIMNAPRDPVTQAPAAPMPEAPMAPPPGIA